MGEWILSSAILILVVIAIRFGFKGKISLRLQYALWGIVMVRLLLPVSLGSSVISVANVTSAIQQHGQERFTDRTAQNSPVVGAENADWNMGNGDKGNVQDNTAWEDKQDIIAVDKDVHNADNQELPSNEKTKQPQEQDLSQMFWKGALVLWGVGMAGLTSFLLVSNLRFRYKLEKNRREMETVGRKIKVYVTSGIDTPCLFGLLRPAIYVTEEAAKEPKTLRHCVAHEYTHYRHADHIWSICRCICLILHWYDPLVWWAAFLSQRDGELACDEATIARLGEEERAEYGRTLIGMTCQKRSNILMAATTMTASKGGIRERILLIAKKPKMAVCTLLAVLLIAAIAVGCTFTGGKTAQQEADTEVKTEPTTPTAESGEQTYSAEDYVGMLDAGTVYGAPEEDKLYIRLNPTGVSTAGDDYRYLIPGNQELFLSAFEKAVEQADEKGSLQEDDSLSGWTVCYQGAKWLILSDGAMVGISGGRVSAHFGAQLYALCSAAAMEAGLSETVRPDELVGICSATLKWNEDHTITVTDKAAMEYLEERLYNSETRFGGASCWFTALLTLELETGETKTIAMATDSCGTWMSEGVFYSYSELTEDGYKDNSDFYSLFLAEVIYDVFENDRDNVWDYLRFLDWGRYAEQCGSEAVFDLMDYIKTAAKNDQTNHRVYTMLSLTKGLDGAYTDYYCSLLNELYNGHEKEFAYYCFDMPYVDNSEDIFRFLAYARNTTADEVRAMLESAHGE